ncbi:acyltransferase domain-containing protein [Catenulispora sp. NL8]|uniref:Acyltransferase domain-containing protein n=1 Tax=Catenulispora pinistramenti TaxID=2705254 RepID=A0ABS5KTQ7_9ACTN|nr:type I polyketide synthase [Catenulispora pinistramenti]MBS2549394.1 acyltransferase domain-containing protein [Catenulispora pinistramenti]
MLSELTVLSTGELAEWLRSEISRRVGCAPEEIRDDEPFSAYGLDSMRATDLAVALSELCGDHISPTVLWAYPTVGALAGHLVGGVTAAAPPRPRTRRDGPPEPIAVVGLACRFPGGADVSQFWRLLSQGRDAVREVPAERWDVTGLVDADPAAAGTMVTARAGFLDQPLDGFDPLFFGISPREAQEMDPQQRLFLEVAWEALEDAGLAEEHLHGTRTGVFAGSIWHDYADLAAGHRDTLSTHSATGRAANMVANRLSYALDLRGPSVTLDSACSSSLLAIHLACQSLWTGESVLALAGGVNLLLNPDTMVSLTKFGGLAPDGLCKAFDARADGFGRGEGCGVVVLKPLSRALADGDDLWCLIRGSATNNDGLSNGLTAPNPIAQQEVLREAYRVAEIAPERVGYVEAHGTGTMLGDPIEVAALGAVLGPGRAEPLVLGSVKTNIGHLEAAAGVAGFIKTALILRHRRIPPSLHFEQPNPHIPFQRLGVRVPVECEDWPEGTEPLAGVSAFGWGGTNVHVILERFEESPKQTPHDFSPASTETRPKLGFICSPYGQQWFGMGRRMYRTEPVFRAVLEECDRELSRYVEWSLVEELLREETYEGTGDVGVVQPILFALQVALARWLEAAGARPDVVVGHSLGEIAASVIAGVLDLPDAVRLVHHYSDQQRRVAGLGGGMAVAEMAADDLRAYLAERGARAEVATMNGPRTTALAGEQTELAAIVADLKSRGVLSSLIRVDLAAHSPAIDAVTADLTAAIGTLTPHPPRLPMISTVTAEPLDWPSASAEYFVANLRRPVRLAEATGLALAGYCDLLVEISAHPVLLAALRQSAEDSAAETGREVPVLGAMRRDDDDRSGPFELLAALAGHGVDVRLPGRADSRGELFVLSAKAPEALRALAEAVADTGPDQQDPDVRLPDLVEAANRRGLQPYRLALPAHDIQGLFRDLKDFALGGAPAGLSVSEQPVGTSPKVAFVFPGQGAQWLGMARALLRTEPVFHTAIRECDAAAAEFADWSIEDELGRDEADSRLERIDVVQPVLFAIEVALAALWRSWGVEPFAVVGHSMGEVAASYVAGAISLRDAARIICRRSLIMRRLSGTGAMLAVELTVDEAREAIAGHEDVVSLAVNNSPRSTVLSGDRDVLSGIAEQLTAREVFHRWVKVDVASHSPQMDLLRPDLLTELADVSPRAGTVPIYSTVTGEVLDGSQLQAPYWVANLRDPVLFGDQIAALIGAGVEVFVEMSPHPILLPAVEQVAVEHGTEVAALPSMRRNETEHDTLLESAGRLLVRGGRLDRAKLATPGRRGVRLPTYPWQRDRHWLPDLEGPVESAGVRDTVRDALLGQRFDSPIEPGTSYWQMSYDRDVAAVRDHRIGRAAVLPGAGYVELALAACAEVRPDRKPVISELSFREPLVIPERGTRRVQAVLEGGADQTARLRVFAPGPEGAACVAQMQVSYTEDEAPAERGDLTTLEKQFEERVSGPDYYRILSAHGLDYGPAYQGLTRICRQGAEALALVEPTAEVVRSGGAHQLHPALLDAALQAAVAPMLGPGWGGEDTEAFLSEGLGRLVLHRCPTGPFWAHAVCRADEDGRHWAADVRLYDPDGTVLAEVSGLRGVRLAQMPQLADPADIDPDGADLAAIGEGAEQSGRELIAALPSGPERRAALEGAVRDAIAKVVRIAPDRVEANRPLRTLGLDSLLALELSNRLGRIYGIRLSATLAYNYPTVQEMAPFLAERLDIPLDDPAPVPTPASPTPGESHPHPIGEPADGELSDSPAALLERELAELNVRMETI